MCFRRFAFMKSGITIAGVTVDSGKKVSAYVKIPGTDYSFPMTIINGVREGKILLASAGIHGWEYPGILATLRVAEEVDPKDVSGAIILPHIINISGFEERQTYVVPADEKRQNLNRMYPGDPDDNTLAGKIVRFTTEIAENCDFHIDLHSGDAVEDLQPIVIVGNGQGPELEESIAAAKVTCFPYRMISGGEPEYYNSSIINLHKPALLFERGGNGTYTEEEVEEDKNDILAIARFLGILPGEAPENTDQIFVDQKTWLEADATGMYIPFAKAGDMVSEGQKLYEIRDVWGNLLHEEFARYDARVFITPNTLAIKKGDDTVMYGHLS